MTLSPALRKTAYVATAVMLLLMLAGVRVHDMSMRTDLHADEVYSLMLAQCNPSYSTLPPDGCYSGAELKEMLAERHSAGEDIAQLWVNNGDTPHASLYYMALRLALGNYDHWDPSGLAWRGGMLNMLFFILSYLLLWAIVRRLWGESILLTLATLATAFGNTMAINNTLLVREYQMAETFLLWFTLVAVEIIISMRHGEPILPRRWVMMGLAVALAMSTGYLNAYYIIMVSAGITIAAWRYSRHREIAILTETLAGGVILAWALYAGFFNFLLHKSVHTSRAFGSLCGALTLTFVRDIVYGLFTMAGVRLAAIVLIAALIFKGGRLRLVKSPDMPWLPIVAMVAMLAVQYTSVLKMPRYGYPLVPMVTLIVPHLLSCVPRELRIVFSIAALIYYPYRAVSRPTVPRYGWEQTSKLLKEPAMIYGLNPNELVLVSPCLNDSTTYQISSARVLNADTVTRMVSRQMQFPAGLRVKSAPVAGRHIKLYVIESEDKQQVNKNL